MIGSPCYPWTTTRTVPLVEEEEGSHSLTVPVYFRGHHGKPWKVFPVDHRYRSARFRGYRLGVAAEVEDLGGSRGDSRGKQD